MRSVSASTSLLLYDLAVSETVTILFLYSPLTHNDNDGFECSDVRPWPTLRESLADGSMMSLGE